jgi:hypothetical protein
LILERDLDPFPADAALELVGVALGDHHPVVDDRDVVGEPVGLVQVLGGEQDGGSGGNAVLDHLPEAQPAAGVEAGRGLVEEDHGRAGDERGGQVQAAAHASGVGLDRSVGGVQQVEALEEVRGSRLRLALGQVVEASDHDEVLGARQVLVDRRVLAGEADPRPQRSRVVDHVETGDPGATAVGREERGQDPDRRRLAGAIRAQQAEHGAGLDRQVDPAQRLDVLVGLTQPTGLDRQSTRHEPQPSAAAAQARCG